MFQRVTKSLAITNIKAFKLSYEAHCFQIALLNLHIVTLKLKTSLFPMPNKVDGLLSWVILEFQKYWKTRPMSHWLYRARLTICLPRSASPSHIRTLLMFGLLDAFSMSFACYNTRSLVKIFWAWCSKLSRISKKKFQTCIRKTLRTSSG